MIEAQDLDGYNDLFGFRFQGGSNGLVTIFIEDDTFWHPKMTFDVFWLPYFYKIASEALNTWETRNDPS